MLMLAKDGWFSPVKGIGLQIFIACTPILAVKIPLTISWLNFDDIIDVIEVPNTPEATSSGTNNCGYSRWRARRFFVFLSSDSSLLRKLNIFNYPTQTFDKSRISTDNTITLSPYSTSAGTLNRNSDQLQSDKHACNDPAARMAANRFEFIICLCLTLMESPQVRSLHNYTHSSTRSIEKHSKSTLCPFQPVKWSKMIVHQ